MRGRGVHFPYPCVEASERSRYRRGMRPNPRLSALALLLVGCSREGGPAPVAGGEPRPQTDWHAQVGARVADAAHAFRSDGEGFHAVLPGVGMTARIRAGGATLADGVGAVRVAATAWGRPDALQPMAHAAPAWGDCDPGRADPEGRCIRRVALQGSGIDEWWSASVDGVQQGWTVQASPPGAGPVVIRVAIDATATVEHGAVWLLGDDGGEWVVSGLAAWDADGVPLPATFEEEAGGLRVQVDDRGARYPIVIDPVYTSATTTLTSASSAARHGTSVAGAGDVNGDGFGDVIVGAEGGTGAAYLYEGSPTGVATVASATLTVSASQGFGESVAGAGDVNGDGYDDVVVGDPSTSTGRAYVFHGSAAGLSTSPDTTLSGGGINDSFGKSVAGAGDVNGDGFDDVVVGDDAYVQYWGNVRVFHGSSSGVSTTASVSLTAGSTATYYTYFGRTVAGAGDVDGDGYDDIVVGARGASSFAGQAYVYTGSSSGISSSAVTTLSGAAGASFGISVAGAGDVDADGYDDVIVGASGISSTDYGAAYVYAGGAGGLATSASASLAGEAVGSGFGGAVAGAGDVNGDGYADVVVGAASYASSSGRAYVFTGGAGGVTSTADSTLSGSASARFGAAVGGAGDVDGDSYADVIVGAPYYSSYAGCAYVHHGYADDDADGYASVEDCDDGDPDVHPGATERVADGVDQDCDAVDDCYQDDDGDNHGTAVVISGTSLSCDAGAGAPDASDCNDRSAAIHPGVAEVVADGIDQDCDAVDACFADADGDGYGMAAVVDGSSLDCEAGDGASSSDDCDDTRAAVHPGASEVVADGVDQDCDDVDACYADADGDAFGTDRVVAGSALSCESGEGAAVAGDCDDGAADIHPAAPEVPADGVDSDCDGVEACYVDGDGDGHGGDTLQETGDFGCDSSGVSSTGDDCDDARADIGPAAVERCNALDDDCDGVVDPPTSQDASAWYRDADGDAYGDDATRAVSCDPGDGFVRVGGDCRDDDPGVFPGADAYARICDGAAGCGCDTPSSGAARGGWALAALALSLGGLRRRPGGT